MPNQRFLSGVRAIGAVIRDLTFSAARIAARAQGRELLYDGVATGVVDVSV